MFRFVLQCTGYLPLLAPPTNSSHAVFGNIRKFRELNLSAPARCWCRVRKKSVKMSVGSVNRDVHSEQSIQANFRLCNVSGYMTEMLEIEAKDPKLYVIVIPGNPGIVTFYKEFVESLYELLAGAASVTGHGIYDVGFQPLVTYPTQASEENRALILLLGYNVAPSVWNTVMNFMDRELKNNEVPIVLVGHSIGSYISIEMFKRAPDKVIYCVGLYPFLMLNKSSSKQISIQKLAESHILSGAASATVALLSFLPRWATRCIAIISVGRSWSATAVEAACSHLVKYHTMRNMLFMAKTEFQKLTESPDWDFMREKRDQIAFLFGTDDHWGPLSMHEEISKQLPDVPLTIEREGYTHAFSCTIEGSLWVAQHVAILIEKHVTKR